MDFSTNSKMLIANLRLVRNSNSFSLAEISATYFAQSDFIKRLNLLVDVQFEKT